MKAKSVAYLAFIFSFFFTIAGCNNREETDPDSISSKITDHSDCKLTFSESQRFVAADTTSCVVWEYNPQSLKLTIQHVNAGFNCCPEGFYCKTTLKNDTITIREYENDNGCDCLCLFDLIIEFEGISLGTYTAKFIEPYADADEDQLIFPIDLSASAVGSFCVTRKEYPWGE